LNRKRNIKAAEKEATEMIKADGRTNRSENTEELISYYDRGFEGMDIKQLKNLTNHPDSIKMLLSDSGIVKKLSQYVRNKRRQHKK